MKKMILTLVLFASFCNAQRIITTPIIINNDSGNVIGYLNYCTQQPSIIVNKDLVYHAFSETEGIKSINGQIDRKLIHGNVLTYYSNGNLRGNKNFHLGLYNGVNKIYFEDGGLERTTKYDMGIPYYERHTILGTGGLKMEEEFIGWGFDFIGFEHNRYIKNKLVFKEIKLNDGKKRKYFFYDTGMPEQIFIQDSLNIKVGKYEAFHYNNKLKVSGNFLNGNRDGIWKYFNEDGSLEEIEQFLGLSVNFRVDKTISARGGLIFDDEEEEWVRQGTWWFYDYKGVEVIKTLIYSFGEEVKE